MIFSNFRTPRITEVVRVFKNITWNFWTLVPFGFLIFFHQNEQGWKRTRKKTWRRNSLIKNFKHIPKCQFRAVCETGKLFRHMALYFCKGRWLIIYLTFDDLKKCKLQILHYLLEQVFDDIWHLCIHILRWIHGLHEGIYEKRACLHSFKWYEIIPTM